VEGRGGGWEEKAGGMKGQGEQAEGELVIRKQLGDCSELVGAAPNALKQVLRQLVENKMVYICSVEVPGHIL
jgi:hypothetical protein